MASYSELRMLLYQIKGKLLRILYLLAEPGFPLTILRGCANWKNSTG
jgi:hypothetical protein